MSEEDNTNNDNSDNERQMSITPLVDIEDVPNIET